MSGVAGGTDGAAERRAFFWALTGIGLVVAAFNAVNVMSVLHDLPHLDPREPVIWEGTSWISFMLFAPLAYGAVRLAPLNWPPREGWRLAIHLPAMALFSLGHVIGFMLLRKVIYAALGGHYTPGVLSDFFYECRKDLFGYALAALAFQLARSANLPAAAAPASTFDIRDGARLIRTPVSEILAVTAAGNYVEFLLADGRRPLMRSPLSTLEHELAPLGFVRTHRSWLVNRAVVRGLEPEGSGDYRVLLDGAEAPLSRRFRPALEKIRG